MLNRTSFLFSSFCFFCQLSQILSLFKSQVFNLRVIMIDQRLGYKFERLSVNLFVKLLGVRNFINMYMYIAYIF